MSYIGAKPAEQILSSADIQDGAVSTVDLADASITQAKVASGVAGTGPVFWAYANTPQNITTNTSTLTNYGAKLYDTANCFNTSTGAFTPNVAGYYQVNASSNANSTITRSNLIVYKNGNGVIYGNDVSGASQINSMQLNGFVYLNGTTDYIQIYTRFTGTSPQIYGGTGTYDYSYTFFQAALIRSA